MPVPSKFTRDRQTLIVELLSAGASRREVARRAGISPKTLRRWLERGSKALPGGRWHWFFKAVASAEQGDPILVELKRQFDEPDPPWNRRYLDAGLRLPEWESPDTGWESPEPPLPAGFAVEVRQGADAAPADLDVAELCLRSQLVSRRTIKWAIRSVPATERHRTPPPPERRVRRGTPLNPPRRRPRSFRPRLCRCSRRLERTRIAFASQVQGSRPRTSTLTTRSRGSTPRRPPPGRSRQSKWRAWRRSDQAFLTVEAGSTSGGWSRPGTDRACRRSNHLPKPRCRGR
jgi:hypothetical protein